MSRIRLSWFTWPAVCALSTVGLVGVGAGSAVAAVCTSAVVGDINGDGEADVAVGEPGDDGFAGAVHVFYGSPVGLVADPSGSALNDQILTQDSAGVPGASEVADGLGVSAELSDLNGDGCADLAAGVPGENDGRGSVIVLYGSSTGLTTTGAQVFTENSVFGAGSGQVAESFGVVLTAADLDDDGIADLAVGVPGEEVTSTGANRGAVAILYGATTGLGTGATASELITQNSPGVPGTAENADRFGEALSSGDFDGNGVSDLAVGVPGENSAAGLVEILPGQPGGGLGAGAAVFSQNTAGVPGVAEPGDQFGFAVDGGDATGDGRADLAVGAAGENTFRGAVSFLPGSATGLTGTGSQIWTQDSPGIAGIAAADDGFGFSLVMAPLDNGPLADLAIGVPFDDIGSIVGAGGVNVLLGTATGLTTSGAGQRFTQDTAGVAGSAEAGDGFGYTLGSAGIQTTDQDNLIVGAPFESVGSVQEAGILHQLTTNEFGPNPVGSVSMTLNTTGVQGTPERSSLFTLGLS